MTAINFTGMGVTALGGMQTLGAASKASMLPDLSLTAKSGSVKESYARQKAEFDQYIAQRNAAAQVEYGDEPPNMVAVAMPVNANGFSPFVTAGQQKLIDSITAQYAGKSDLSGLMEALAAKGVHPSQIAAHAEYWVGAGGKVADSGGAAVTNTLVDITV